MTNVTYSPTALKLINNITHISNELVIQKDSENNNIVSIYNPAMGCILKIPNSQLNYDKEIIFSDYKEFFNIFSTVSSAGDVKLNIDENVVNLVTPNTTIKYLQGYSEKVADEAMGSIDFGLDQITASFTISSDELKEVQTLIKLLIDKTVSDSTITSKATVTIDKGEVKILFESTGGSESCVFSGNSFERTFKETSGTKTTQKIVSDPKFYLGLPASNYTVAFDTSDEDEKLIEATTEFTKDGELIANCSFFTGSID